MYSCDLKKLQIHDEISYNQRNTFKTFDSFEYNMVYCDINKCIPGEWRYFVLV